MRIKLIILAIYFLLFGGGYVFATDPPTLSSPTNNSTVSSSTLNWQAPSYTLYTSSPYRIQVDDDSAFGSLNKDYYTSNTHYSPSLSTGTWYWRVKAKDQTGTWSNWSDVWSFTLSTATSNPTSTPTPTANPTPTPTSTNSANPTSSSFVISNLPTQTNSDQSFNTTINLSLPDNSNSSFYLKAAFKKADGSNYFGFTKVSGNWVKNGASYSSQYKITTDSQGNWSGSIEAKPDNEDSGFTGSGDYIFKIGRYNSSGSGLTWSNEVTIKINAVSEATETTSSDKKESSNEKTSTESPLPTPTPKTVLVKSNTTNPSVKYQIASIAGVNTSTSSATPSATTFVKDQKQLNLIFITGIVLTIAGVSSLGYIYWKRK